MYQGVSVLKVEYFLLGRTSKYDPKYVSSKIEPPGQPGTFILLGGKSPRCDSKIDTGKYFYHRLSSRDATLQKMGFFGNFSQVSDPLPPFWKNVPKIPF